MTPDPSAEQQPYPDPQTLRAMCYGIAMDGAWRDELECLVNGEWKGLIDGIGYYIRSGYRLRIHPDYDKAAAPAAGPQPSRSDVAPGHNPDRLTVTQVGEGWRLLDEDEIVRHKTYNYEVEVWCRGMRHWLPFNSSWTYKDATFKTRLSRAELRAARGLEAEPETTECLRCGCAISGGEAKTFTICSACWAQEHPHRHGHVPTPPPPSDADRAWADEEAAADIEKALLRHRLSYTARSYISQLVRRIQDAARERARADVPDEEVRELLIAARRATGDLAERAALDMDHHSLKHPQWYAVVERCRKAVAAMTRTAQQAEKP